LTLPAFAKGIEGGVAGNGEEQSEVSGVATVAGEIPGEAFLDEIARQIMVPCQVQQEGQNPLSVVPVKTVTVIHTRIYVRTWKRLRRRFVISEHDFLESMVIKVGLLRAKR